jgi:hypothetical protein
MLNISLEFFGWVMIGVLLQRHAEELVLSTIRG